MFTQILLKKGKEEPLRRFHPWVFSGAIDKIKGKVQEGDIVEVFSATGEYLATGFYQHNSIAVKIFSFERTDADYAFWKEKIRKAFVYRQSIGASGLDATNAYRLFFTEGDGIPGLIADVYASTVVIQAHTAGVYALRHQLADAITEVLGEKVDAVYDKSCETLPGIATQNEYLKGEKSSTIIKENNHRFHIDWEQGQKTGFFLDQCCNRQLLATYAAGRNVLNMFCYTGGFSVYALQAGAERVVSLDSSRKAIELTEENVAINSFTGDRHQSIVSDAKKYLENLPAKYDLIILDPPAFAKHLSQRKQAIKGYKYINYQVIKHIKPGGLLFTFSCSQAIDRNLFTSTVVSAAIEAGRNVRIMHHLTQSPDHPVNAFHPEGEYLKGLVLWVE
ncbi:MAG: class I SAM-dependent rRNA methyltransferase [Lentimicrobiaceae bacterium]|nr:class I SAM-dependent rRNA methyltransferase [Lentimicrobiaceae bacterium]